MRRTRTVTTQQPAQADLSEELRDYALCLGVELNGAASADAYVGSFPDKPQPGLFVKNSRSIVVIGIPYEPTTVASVLKTKELVPFYDSHGGVEKEEDVAKGPSRKRDRR